MEKATKTIDPMDYYHDGYREGYDHGIAAAGSGSFSGVILMAGFFAGAITHWLFT